MSRPRPALSTSRYQTTTQRLISYKRLADSLGSFSESSYNLSLPISINPCAAPRLLYFMDALPMRHSSHGISSDPTLLLPSILSAPKILPCHQPTSFLLTMRTTHLHSAQKDCSTAHGLLCTCVGCPVIDTQMGQLMTSPPSWRQGSRSSLCAPHGTLSTSLLS